MFRPVFGFVLALLFAASLPAQRSRYDLSLRLHEYEARWESASPEARRRSIPRLEEATRRFFTLRLSTAGRELDEATLALRDGPVPAGERLARSLKLALERRLVGAGTEAIGFTLEDLYAAEDPEAPALLATLRVGERVVARTPVGPRPVAGRLDLAGLGPGDHDLILEFRRAEDPEGLPLLRRDSRFSVLADLAGMLARIDAALAAEDVDAAPVRRESLREIRATLARIAEGERLETDLPAAALAATADRWAAMKAPRDEDLLPAGGGEFHLVLRAGETRVPVRVSLPARKDAGPIPLVVALHGMGGSENMFFEGYGAGFGPRLAAERGWIFVAPRLSAFGGFDLGAIVDDLARLAPVDPDRVYLVGHSMGAARALAAATRDPDRWAAAAFLGGGLATRRAEALKGLPILVAAGERDFAKSGARALFASLEAVSGHAARYLETPDTEHMTVVRAALPDVFALFEGARRKPAPGQPEGKEG